MKKDIVNGNEKNKKQYRIKALDVVVVLLILLSVFGIYFRFNLMDKLSIGRNLKEYTVSFEIKDIRYTTEAYMEVGDKVYFYDDGEEFGTLIKASKDASDEEKKALRGVNAAKTVMVEDANGKTKAVEVFYPDDSRKDAYGRMLCKGTYSDENGFLVDGTKYIAPGSVLKIKTELVTVDVIIISIEEAQ